MSAEPGRKAGYSSDIDWRVIWRRLGMEMTFKEIATHLQIAAHRIYHRFEITGSVDALKQGMRPQCRKLDDHHELLVIALLMENPCLYLYEICELIEKATNLKVSGSTVCRVLHRNGLTRKKVQTIAKQRSLH